MDQLKVEVFRDAVLILQAITVLILAYIGKLSVETHANSKENKPKIEETRENVSRLANGGGVAHDHERAVDALQSDGGAATSSITSNDQPGASDVAQGAT